MQTWGNLDADALQAHRGSGPKLETGMAAPGQNLYEGIPALTQVPPGPFLTNPSPEWGFGAKLLLR